MFNDAQRTELKAQMIQNFQLVTQAYVLQRVMNGRFHEQSLWWEQRLVHYQFKFIQREKCLH